MKVLASVQWVMQPLIDPASDDRIKYFSWLITANLVLNSLASSLYIAENYNDLLKITQPLLVVSCCVLPYLKWLSVLNHKDRIQDIFDSLQIIADESESSRMLGRAL